MLPRSLCMHGQGVPHCVYWAMLIVWTFKREGREPPSSMAVASILIGAAHFEQV